MAINKFFTESYGKADIKLAYQKLDRQFKRAGKSFKYTYQQFENRVMNRMINQKTLKPLTLKQAIAKEIHSTSIFGYSSIARENILNAIKQKFPSVYRDIYRMIGNRRDNGKFAPMWEQLQWNENLGKYTFFDDDGNEWSINQTNSPDEIFIERV